MSRLDNTLSQLAPGVRRCTDTSGRYRPKHGLAIYCLPIQGWHPSSPGMALGEALAGRSGLGCTLLDGVPAKIPGGAVVVGLYDNLHSLRPDLLENIPEPRSLTEYSIRLDTYAVISGKTPEAVAHGMQTLAMLVLRHGEDSIPGCVITDAPRCPIRCVAVELESREIDLALLMQIASFAATFKANRIHLILDDDFQAGREIPGLENFTAACESFGIGIGVRVKLLEKILSGERTLIEAWRRLRAAARHFGAREGAFDDICPGDADPETLRRVVTSAAAGETGLSRFSLDARAIVIAGVDPAMLTGSGVTGWHRMWKSATPPPSEFAGIPLSIDVQAPVLGLTSRPVQMFHTRLDVALRDFIAEGAEELLVSFRDIGVSHMWPNLLLPAGTGLIAGWGGPQDAAGASERILGLLYGESGTVVENMWEAVTEAFPPGLSDEAERLFRRTAFGHWPETEEDWHCLTNPEWLDVAQGIRAAAQAVQQAFDGLNRNVGTLMGARLCLYALSWLHCYTALVPELQARLEGEVAEDGRSEAIAKELLSNFVNWRNCMQETQKETGLEFSELRDLDEMGMRIRGMCDRYVRDDAGKDGAE